MQEVKVVIGSNYGDEGKGLVSYCLSKDAADRGRNVLNVLYNGGVQRGHTAAGKVYHCTGTGAAVGADTYYHNRFILDPIALWLTCERPIIDPMCRVVLPCDVVNNRMKEANAGEKRHGSCGMGIFEASKRSKNGQYAVYAKDLESPFSLYEKLREIEREYDGFHTDDLYNLHNFMIAANYVSQCCRLASFDSIYNNYQTIIYEGGQGLLLDQGNTGNFPFLTPSSVGSRNIHTDIEKIACQPEIYYVSRSYMTRHGKGPMEHECSKDEINPDIIDETNIPNEWQGSLRFGYIDTRSLYSRIKEDLALYQCHAIPNVVFTQMNYTNGKIAIGKNDLKEIVAPDFISNIYLSEKKDEMIIRT